MHDDGYIGPFSIETFEEVHSVQALVQGENPKRLIWSPEMYSLDGYSPKGDLRDIEEIQTSHRSNWKIRGAEFLSISNVEVGGNGFIVQNGRVLRQKDINPDGMNDLIREGEIPDIWRIGPFHSESEIIQTDFPVAVITNPHMVYGHFLCEMLPRAALARNLQAAMPELKIAAPYSFPNWMMEFLGKIFPKDAFVRYDSTKQRLKSKKIILPTMMQDSGIFHPYCSHLINGISDLFPTLNHDNRKVYLSRRFCKSWRTITNEIEVESLLNSRGFSIIYPENLSVSEQVALLKASRWVVSPFSSALHGTIFCRPNTRIMSIGYMNNLQNGISRLRGHHMHYFIPKDEGRRLIDYRGGYNIETNININDLNRAIDEIGI